MVTNAEITVQDRDEGSANSADVDTESLTITSGGTSKTVHRQRIRIAGEDSGDLAQVKNYLPTQSDYGLIIRDVTGVDLRRIQELIMLDNVLQQYQQDTSLNQSGRLDSARGSR